MKTETILIVLVWMNVVISSSACGGGSIEPPPPLPEGATNSPTESCLNILPDTGVYTAVNSVMSSYTYPKREVGTTLSAVDITRQHPVCYPPSVSTTSFADYDFTRNGGTRFLTVVSTYYTGCTPGRTDTALYKHVANEFADQNVAFFTSLKNGVNNHVCESWATNDGLCYRGFPYVIDDQSRALLYNFFDGPEHPEYVILDHCMTVRYRFSKLTEDKEDMKEALRYLLSQTFQACPGNAAAQSVETVYDSATSTCENPQLQSGTTQAVTGAHGLSNPRDVKFHPLTGELWVANTDTDDVTIVTLGNAGVGASARGKADRAPYHYMDQISSLSFSPSAWFATCQESPNDYDGMKTPNFFMGPSLYEDVQTIGQNPINVDNQGRACGNSEPLNPEASETCFFTHSDMLHSVPYCMGIAFDPERNTPYKNVYWAFDGHSGMLIRYDFEQPHYPGSLDHNMANVRRFPEVQLTRVPGVVGHIVVDEDPHTVYIADTGGNRIIALDADSGRFNQQAREDLGGEYTIWSSTASTFEYSLYTCAKFTTLVSDVPHPSGIALRGDFLYIASHSTGNIHIVHKTSGEVLQTVSSGLSSPNGLTVDPSGTKLYITDSDTNTVHFMDIQCDSSGSSQSTSANIDYPPLACPTATTTELGIAVALEHEDGYLNMGQLGPDYGVTEECLVCAEGCDNDMLLMSGFLCHPCLPNKCHNDQPCENLIGRGYVCNCEDGFSGDLCQDRVGSGSPTGAPTLSPSVGPTVSPTVAPTDHMHTNAPTSPTTSPTDAPTSLEPTNSPTSASPTDAPTNSPTTITPTTSAPTTSAPQVSTTFSASSSLPISLAVIGLSLVVSMFRW